MILSCKAEELFKLVKYNDVYIVRDYLKKDDPTITELEIPEEYNGLPVVTIGCSAFYRSNYLKSVRLSKNLSVIDSSAFEGCTRLERVEFQSSPIIYREAFSGCPKLPPETVVIGIVCSTDITRPVPIYNCDSWVGFDTNLPDDCFRPDVFELLVKNNCFRDFRFNYNIVCYGMIDNNRPELFQIAERYGMLEDAGLVDSLLDYSAENQRVEITAYLLELKKRKFGFADFEGGNDFEL